MLNFECWLLVFLYNLHSLHNLIFSFLTFYFVLEYSQLTTLWNFRWTVKQSCWVRHTCCGCSVVKSCPTLCDPMNCSMPGFPVLHHLLEFAQTPVHWVSDTMQPSRPLSSLSPAFNRSQHQGLFQWVSSLHQVAKVLELQLQYQSSQQIFRVNFL